MLTICPKGETQRPDAVHGSQTASLAPPLLPRDPQQARHGMEGHAQSYNLQYIS